MPVLFSVTLFLSAFLLFLVQPMMGKIVLPALGGTAAVWNTCMVFFQAMLLAGYTYAHFLTTRLKPRTQVYVHAAICFLPLMVLPIKFRAEEPPASENPIPWLISLLAFSVGLPFFVLSTTAPLLQKWYARTDAASAKDPYFLYAASNAGSMLALLSYPFLVEPYLSLKTGLASQTSIWAMGYITLLFMLLWCSQSQLRKGVSNRADTIVTDLETPPPSRLTMLRWVILAFAPSSLMLGVTTYITVDIAAIPLLWVLPLALYLLSYIFVFAKWPAALHQAVLVMTPLSILIVLFVLQARLSLHFSTTIQVLLACLFLVALACHGELARTRPSDRYLTSFYLLMSVGGVLGGLFNCLVAPLLFNDVHEHLIALILTCMLLPQSLEQETTPVKWIPRLALTAFGVALVLFITWGMHSLQTDWYQNRGAGNWLAHTFARSIVSATNLISYDLDPSRMVEIVAIAIPLLLCYVFIARPVRFGLCVAAFCSLSLFYQQNQKEDGDLLHQERSFFGVLQVREQTSGNFLSHSLLHGTTLHGTQFLDHGMEDFPLTYFHRTGPIGQVMAAMEEPLRKERVGIIGLGSGTMACYSQDGQEIDYYEIDPAIERVARDPKYFTFLRDCERRGTKLRVILGDARLRLQHARDNSYAMIIVDAFSSDAIPVHLLTREAIELYFKKLRGNGLLVMHISNRHLDISPVLGNLAKDLGLAAIEQYDEEEMAFPPKASSDWVVFARHRGDLQRIFNLYDAAGVSLKAGALATLAIESTLVERAAAIALYACETPGSENPWKELPTAASVGIWTDDYSNLLKIFKW